MEKQAAKRKVAIEKATARKMAKESMDRSNAQRSQLLIVKPPQISIPPSSVAYTILTL